MKQIRRGVFETNSSSTHSISIVKIPILEKDIPYNATEQAPLRLGVHTLPKLPRDNTDRNRTSPFAFTGNKFEFRMLGSSDSIACTNIMLNTAVAESLRLFADELEAAEDFESALHALIRRTVSEHKRIIFSGNGYDEAWIREATEVRGLPNYPSTPDCVPMLTAEKNLRLFAQHKIYTPVEAASRRDVILDNYCKVIHIEALTMIDMVRRDILPAISRFTGALAESGRAKREFCVSIDTNYESDTITKLSELTTAIMAGLVYALNYFGISVIYIGTAVLTAYIPLLIVLLILWYVIGKVIAK
jgi:glutamine synthetase